MIVFRIEFARDGKTFEKKAMEQVNLFSQLSRLPVLMDTYGVGTYRVVYTDKGGDVREVVTATIHGDAKVVS